VFEVIVTGPGGLKAEATADSPENAVLAARTLWDEVYDSTVTGRLARQAMVVTVILDGEHVAMVNGRKP